MTDGAEPNGPPVGHARGASAAHAESAARADLEEPPAPGRAATDVLSPLAAARGSGAALGVGAREAQHPVGHRLQAGGRYRSAARVAASVGALVELGQCPLRPGQAFLQRASDADLRQAADRLDRPVADALAEPLRAAELRALGERGKAIARAIAPLLERSADGSEVLLIDGRGHMRVSTPSTVSLTPGRR